MSDVIFARRYVPPFLPIYCERLEDAPWDGCVFRSTARAIDAATGGRLQLTEAELRAVVNNPDRPGVVDGSNLAQAKACLDHYGVTVVVATSGPQLTDWLRAGGAAVCIGPANRMPPGERVWDQAYYDSGKGHAVYLQGGPTGEVWGNPEHALGIAEPVYAYGSAPHFVFPVAIYGGALLVTPAEEAAMFPVVTVTPFRAPRTFTGSAKTYDPARPGAPVGQVTGGAADASVSVAWQGTTTPPVPFGAPFLRLAGTSLLIAAKYVVLGPEAPDPVLAAAQDALKKAQDDLAAFEAWLAAAPKEA